MAINVSIFVDEKVKSLATRKCSLHKSAGKGVMTVAFLPSAAAAVGNDVSLKLYYVPKSTQSVPMRSVVWWTAPSAPSITDPIVSALRVRGFMMLKSYSIIDGNYWVITLF